MRVLEAVAIRLPYLYLLGAAGLIVAVAVVGLVPTPLSYVADDKNFALTLRSIVSLPIPILLASYFGVSVRNPSLWILSICAAYLMAVPLPFAVVGLFCLLLCAVILIFNPARTETPESERTPKVLPAVAGAILFTMLLRGLAIEEPFERDLMVYAVVAQGWLEGLSLYSGAWDHKPPAIYFVYALALFVFGQNAVAIFVVGVATFVVTLLGVKSVAQQLAGPRAGYAAVLVWAIVGNDPILQAQQPNVEVFVNACLIWALALLVPVAKTPKKLSNIVGAGVLLFVATMFKQIAVFPALTIALWLAYLSVGRQASNAGMFLWGAVKPVILFALPGLLGWLAVFLGYYANGNFDEFLYGAFAYNQSYAGSLLQNFYKLAFRAVSHPLYVTIFFFSMVLAGAMRDKNTGLLIVGVGFGLVAMIAAPGNNFPHYYQFLLLVVTVGGGLVLARLASPREILVAVCVLFAPVWVSFGYFTSGDRIASVKYGAHAHGGESVEAKKVGRWLERNAPQDTRMFHWGAHPGVYFWSGYLNRSRFSYSFPLMLGPRASEFTEDVLEDLLLNPPEIVVISTNMIGHEHQLSVFLNENYVRDPRAPSFEFFEVRTRKVSKPQ